MGSWAVAEFLSDQRHINRHRIFMRGIIAFNEHHSTLECTVRNYSEGGCQIRCDVSHLAPDAFDLLIELEGIWFPCEVVWRKPPLLGVVFVGEPWLAKKTRKQVLSAPQSQETPKQRR